MWQINDLKLPFTCSIKEKRKQANKQENKQTSKQTNKKQCNKEKTHG